MRLRGSKIRYRRRYSLVPILLMTIFPILVVWSNVVNRPYTSNANHDASLPSPLCRRGDPLAGVYNPENFRIISNCELGTGVVNSTAPKNDGGFWVDVTLDSKYARLLSPENFNHRNGELVLEQPPGGQAAVPSVRERIVFVGPLVYDRENQFNAICPVWSITPT